MRLAAPGELGGEACGMQGAAVRVMIGPAIALHNFGRAQGLPALAANRWDRVAQQQQGGDVVAIRPPSGSLTMG